MKLFLHLGLPKTGSTAIQTALMNSTEELARCEIILFNPDKSSDPTRSLTNLYKEPNERIKVKMGGEEKIKKNSKKSWEKYYEIINTNNAKKMIYSSEKMPPLLNNLEFMKHLVPDNINDVKFLAYVREPVDHFFSSLNQRIRAGVKLSELFDTSFYSHVDHLVKFLKSNSEKVQTKEYLSNKFSNFDIVDDFENSINNYFSTDVKLSNASHGNKSISLAAIALLFLYNKFNEEVKLDTNSIEERQKIIKKLRKFETTETISLQDVINQNKFKKLSWYALKKSHSSVAKLKKFTDIDFTKKDQSYLNQKFEMDELRDEIIEFILYCFTNIKKNDLKSFLIS